MHQKHLPRPAKAEPHIVDFSSAAHTKHTCASPAYSFSFETCPKARHLTTVTASFSRSSDWAAAEPATPQTSRCSWMAAWLSAAVLRQKLDRCACGTHLSTVWCAEGKPCRLATAFEKLTCCILAVYTATVILDRRVGFCLPSVRPMCGPRQR